MKVKAFLLFSDKMSTKMMQAFGVFEPFKVVIKPLVVLELDEQDRFTEKNAQNIVEAKDNPYELVAAFDKDTVFYTNPNVKAVSTGEKWAILEDYIKGIQSHV